MKDEIVDKIIRAIDKLIEKDRYLLHVDSSERSISHRLAIYIEQQFPDWDVDCEYNRDEDYIKKLPGPARETSDADLNAVTVLPDIIVHKRGESENLIVLEMKKSSNKEDEEHDREKLERFREEYGYRYTVFLKLNVAPNVIGVDKLEVVIPKVPDS